jgi:diaminopimelate epimerase
METAALFYPFRLPHRKQEGCFMNFTKMHGLGNDYIFLNCMEAVPENLDELARRLSDRHFGIGGDGIICVCPSQRADFKMRIFNADGSEGAMCGNGIRCFGKYVYDKGLTDKAHLTVETLSGNRELSLMMEDRRVTGAVVGMGIPDLQQPAEIAVKGMTYTANLVSMGNPHAVIEVEDPAAMDLQAVGPAVERHPVFPHRVNVEFVRVLGRGGMQMRVWERGSGETMACGTGACASAAAMMAAGKLDRDAKVQLAGGDLLVRWDEKSGQMFMTGPACTVFDGKLAD